LDGQNNQVSLVEKGGLRLSFSLSVLRGFWTEFADLKQKDRKRPLRFLLFGKIFRIAELDSPSNSYIMLL